MQINTRMTTINRHLKTKVNAGFTLIEVIVGIVVLSISFSLLTTLIYPLANQSAEQVHQIRAAELGQSMINEILGRAFDEKSDMAGGFIRCGESSVACTDKDKMGADLDSLGNTETRANYDDVDDYDVINFSGPIQNSLGADISALYVGFSMNVDVINDANYDASGSGDNSTAKLITITVRTPQNFDFIFSVYKVNF
jgi:MSHA pilin protein MshD